MLNDYPADVPYLRFHELEDLDTRVPDDAEEAVDRLQRLLPLLGDELVPVWTSPPFPFQPVALASFEDKEGKPLVSVACESGLVAVSSADRGQDWTSLQIPDVQPPGGGRIHGLWASQAVRPFGPWIELHVLVEPRGSDASRPHRLYRALVRSRDDGRVELVPVSEDPGVRATYWEPEHLPERLRWLEQGKVFYSGGADPFDPMSSLYWPSELRDRALKPGNLVAYGGGGHAAWVERGDRLRAWRTQGEVAFVELDDVAQALVCLSTKGDDAVRVILANERKRLEARKLQLRCGEQESQPLWSQSLRGRILAVDCAPSADRGPDVWHDLYVANNFHEVIRYARVGSDRLQKHWEAGVRHLGIRDAKGWLDWCRDRFDEASDIDTAKGRSLHRLLHYLALDRLLTEDGAVEHEECREALGELYSRERYDALLLPAIRKLESNLREWEETPSGTGRPDLAWVCYDKKPFRIQEVLDVHFRGIPEGRREDLARVGGENYAQLLKDSWNVEAFYDPADQPMRRAGIRLNRALEPFVTAAFYPGGAVVVGCRHLVALSRCDESRFVAVGSSGLDLYEIEEVEHPKHEVRVQRIRRSQPEHRELVRASKLAHSLKRPDGREVVLLGTRHGQLFTWNPDDGSIRRNEELRNRQSGEPEGQLGAAVPMPDTESLLVAENRHRRTARLLEVGLGDHDEPVIRRTWETPLRQINTVETFSAGGKLQVLAGEYGDMVLLELKIGDKNVIETGRRHLGSTVLDACLLGGVSESPLVAYVTRNGHLFASEVDPNLRPWQRIRWIHHVTSGGVRTVEGLRGSGRVGVVGARGQLAIYDRNGRRTFLYPPYDPTEAATFVAARPAGGPEYLVVAHESGILTLLRSTGRPEDNLERARKALPEESEAWKHNDFWQTGWALQQFDLGEDPGKLFEKLDYAKARRALLWMVSRSEGSAAETLEGLAKKLAAEDLTFLLRELKEDDVQRREVVEKAAWQKLGDLTVRSDFRQVPALLSEVLRSARRSEAPHQGDRLRRLPVGAFESSWLAHLVVEQLFEELDPQAEEDPGLLARLLTELARFPMVVTEAAAARLSGGHGSPPLEGTLRALVRLGEALGEGVQEGVVETGVRDLATDLAPWQGQTTAVGLFARYLHCLATCTDDSRRGLLEILADAGTYGNTESFLGLICQRMALWLPRKPPGDTAALSTWMDWLQETGQRLRLRSLEEQLDELGTEFKDLLKAERVWRKLCETLLRQGRHALAKWIDREEERLRSEVRLHLRPRNNRRPSRMVAELEVTLIPEALRKTKSLRYKVDFGIPGGLGGTGPSLKVPGSIDMVDPVRPEIETVNVRGTVAPDQKEIRVRVSLEWQGGGKHETTVELPLRPPPGARNLATRAPFPDALALWSLALVERVAALRTWTVVVLVDEELGRDGLVGQFEGPDTRTIDLDQALAEVGPGRPYPDHLNLTSFKTALRGGRIPFDGDDTAPPPGRSRTTILVRNCDDLWNRLLTDPHLRPESNEIVNFLTGHASDAKRIVFFLEHEVGQRLRRYFARLTFVETCHLPEETESEEIWREAESWLSSIRSSRISGSGRAALRALGGDLRFASLLARVVEVPGDRKSEALRFLQSEEARRIVRTDLAGLPPSSIQLLMVAACSTTTLRFNQVRKDMTSAEECSSTPGTGKKSKVILQPGERIDSRAKRALEGDAMQHERSLKVEGFSPEGVTETHSTLRSFTTFFSSGQRHGFKNAVEPLVTTAAVERPEGVVRARNPYGRLVRDLISATKSPTEVYRFLTGGASALEGFSFEELNRFSPTALREIQPQLSPAQAEALHQLTIAWQALREDREPSPQDLLRIFRELTGLATTMLAQGSGAASSGEWQDLLTGSRDLLLGLGDKTSEGGHQYYLVILPDPPEHGRLPEPSRNLLKAVKQRGGEGQAKGRVIVLRPGRTGERAPESWVEVTDDDLKKVALHPKPAQAFWAVVRAGAGLRALAPFQTEGALPPGSRIFFGRQQELETILQSAHKQSFLIVGNRQIGKTSLLNQLRLQLEKRPKIQVYHFDLQERWESMKPVLFKLCGSLPELEKASVPELLRFRVEEDLGDGKTPVVLLNEIDKLLEEEPEILRAFRGRSDSAKARFVMTGYVQAARSCFDIESPFYHWTALYEGRPYMVLAELPDQAAKGIIDLLEAPPLELVWESREEKKLGVRTLLERSYRIPHLLQALCLGVVHRLEEKRRSILRASDVEAVARQPGYSPWSHVRKINFGDLVPGIEEADREKADLLVQLILLTAIKRLYFQGNPPPIQFKIRDRDPRSLTFDRGDLREWFPEVLSSLLRGKEFDEAKNFFQRIDLRSVLLGLSLTLILSFDPLKDRYYFQSHLYPIEVQSQLEEGELIDDMIVKTMLRIYSFVT